jgi:hypothetical protein
MSRIHGVEFGLMDCVAVSAGMQKSGFYLADA